MQNIPRIFDENKLIIQIEDNILIYPKAVEVVKQYRERGYRIALIDFDFTNRHLDILPIVDYIKIDFSNKQKDSDDYRNVVTLARKLGKQTIAYNVNTVEDRGRASIYGFDFVQGESVAEMLRTKVKKPQKLKSTFFRLMVAINRKEPEFAEIEGIISMDVSLTFSLLKMINSAYFALPNRVKDVRQALTALGLDQLRKWIYLMTFIADGGMSEEIIKVSFLRATFCQNISSYIKGLSISSEETYLLGMFSILDVLLESPMEDIVKELPITDELKAGLLEEEGDCAQLLNLCKSYEEGKWPKVNALTKELGIPKEVLSKTYSDSVEKVSETWASLSNMR